MQLERAFSGIVSFFYSRKMTWFVQYLQCPDCSGELIFKKQVVCCNSCSFSREQVGRQFNLLPLIHSSYSIVFDRDGPSEREKTLSSIQTERPEITYKGPPAQRDSSGLFSVLNQYLQEDSCLLDLGCGPRDQAIPADYLKYKYVGIDCSGESADILADAHSIPFRDATFNGILSFAVLEHLHNPFIAIREVERVLCAGGVFVGAVSQGEPFHNSFFHQTPYGLLSLVRSTPLLEIVRLWSSLDTLESLARMGRYPRVLRSILQGLDIVHSNVPFLAPRRMMWSKEEKNIDSLFRAGSICFVIKKRC